MFSISVNCPEIGCRHCRLVGSSGLEPPTSRLSGARSNHLSYEPIKLFSMYLVSLAVVCFTLLPSPLPLPSCDVFDFSEFHPSLAAATCRWWRWWDSNPWPPACRAGALPTELHPLIFLRGFFSVTENWTTKIKALYIHRAPLTRNV